MKKDHYNIAVVGASGAVGNEILKVLSENQFPVAELRLLASARSAGKSLNFNGKPVEIQELNEKSFQGIDIALFSAGGSISEKFAPIAAESGAVVVDNTSAFRMDPEVPLVVPEVNAHAIAGYTQKGIIANPNCSTIQMVLPLKPIHEKYHIKRVTVSTYQATSGAGKRAMDELRSQTEAYLKGQSAPCEKFAHPIAFNCLPHIDVFLENGYTKEEMKMVNETKKIFADDSIVVSPTCVRVAVFHGHSESLNIETEKEISVEEVRDLMREMPGVVLVDEPQKNEYPLNMNCVERNEVFVGRIREDIGRKNAINMWVVADNIRKGAATNAVQIAEHLIQNYL